MSKKKDLHEHKGQTKLLGKWLRYEANNSSDNYKKAYKIHAALVKMERLNKGE